MITPSCPCCTGSACQQSRLCARSVPRYRTTRQRSRTPYACQHRDILASSSQSSKVVGLGSVGLDYLAQVVRFPKPDEKIRTTQLETRGGGNCANALTAAARLGLDSFLVSKIGDDGVGEQIEQELLDDGVHTDFLLKAEGRPSPFTYIVVDKTGGTRTCIHTPGAAYTPPDLTPETVQAVLANAALVYFDGRLTEAAVKLAKAARAEGIAVLVEAERLRPTLEELLQEADFVCTSAHFPQQWTGEEALGDALLTTLHRLPQVKWMVTTLGKRGSVMLQRSKNQSGEIHILDELLTSMLQEVASSQAAQSNGDGISSGSQHGCVSTSGVQISAGQVRSSKQALRLQYQRSPEQAAAAATSAQQAAATEASANATPGKSEGYGHSASGQAAPLEDLVAHMIVASAASIPQEGIEDTTGAGDAFIGTILYGVVKQMAFEDILRLAGVVAACKCTALGARPGIPLAKNISQELLAHEIDQ